MFVIIILVSSTKRIGIDSLFMMFGKSFICNGNNKGHKIDPRGTPLMTFPKLE
jgi:hypothetical protein